MNELVALYFRDLVAHRCKARTAKTYRRLVDGFILPTYPAAAIRLLMLTG